MRLCLFADVVENIHSFIFGCAAKVFFNAQKLVVFCYAVSSCRCAGFNLACVNGNCNIRKRGIFRFAAAVGNNAGVACAFGGFDSTEGFGKRANLVYFNEDCVADMFFNAFFKACFIGYKQVVANKLNFLPRRLVSFFQPSQSSSARPSSMDIIGYFSHSMAR